MCFLLRRVLHSLFLLVGASVLSFVVVNLAPGDFYEALRLRADISPGTVSALRSQHGLNESLPIRYVHWVQSTVRGDWGFSLTYNSPARPIIWSRAKNTFLLAGIATLLAWLLALPVGLWCAARPGTWADSVADTGVAILLATPELVLALLLLLVAARTQYFPTGGLMSLDSSDAEFSGVHTWTRIGDIARHLFLPSVSLAAQLLPLLFLHVRTAVREALHSPFVTAAYGYGISFRRVLLAHALPAAANPLISLFGLSLGLLTSSSLVIEAIFGWPGLGQLMLDAIFQRDFFLVVDAGMLATASLILGNLLADVLLYASDPRIRAE
jgi:peptide/nickel transport system permease protein